MKPYPILNRFRNTLVIAAFGSVCSSAPAALVVSLNLTDFVSDVQQIDADETFGVASLGSDVGGWVNLNRTLTDTNLADSTGTPSTVDVSMLAANGWGSGVTAYNDTPMKGFLDDYTATANPVSITFSDLNASFSSGYFAIVYVSGFDANTGASISDGSTTYYYQTLTSPSAPITLTQTTTTTDLGAGNAPFAQYAVFGSDVSPLTADSITFTLDTLYGGGSGIGAVQLVAVPEPGTTILYAGLAALGLLFLRRRLRS
jgi:hypothetical protein